MWLLVVLAFLFAWRFRTAFAVFVFAPFVGTCFGCFIWGVIGLLHDSMPAVSTLGWLIVCFTALIAAIAATEDKNVA